ncbi:hypothetical protein MHYP_G00250100 [Metynnis hypsauchen]
MDLIHSAETSKDLMFGAFPRYAPVWNQSSQTHDLLVKNVTESDLGLYYCALQEKKIINNEKGMHYGDIYHYGNRTTRLSLLDLTAQDLLQTTPTSPESNCGICWKLLAIFCPVCALISSVLSSTCVYCICSRKTKERFKADQRETAKRQQDRRNAQVEGGVCYASLNIQSTGQRHLKTRRAESSDFSTYSEIKRSVPLTWTNKISTNIRFKHPHRLHLPSTSLCDGEIKSRTYHCLMISGAEVEMRVRPGDDVTLYSDCVWKSGFNTVWLRNSSKEQYPPFIISTEDFMRGAHPCYSFVWNPLSETHDLLVRNVSESDLGLYYCAVHEKKITEDETGVILSEDVYHYGSTITRLSLLDTTIPSADPSTPPVSDCSVCWKLLVSVCSVYVLVSTTCGYCICKHKTKGSEERRELLNENVFQVGFSEYHQYERSMNGRSCFHTEVYYTSLKSALKSN